MSPVAQSKRRSCSLKYSIRATSNHPQSQIQDICPSSSTSATRKPNQPQAIQPQKHRCPPIRPLSRGKGGHHRKGKSIEPCRGGNVSATNSTLPSNLAALPLQYTARMSTRYGGAVTRRQRLRRPNRHGTANGPETKIGPRSVPKVELQAPYRSSGPMPIQAIPILLHFTPQGSNRPSQYTAHHCPIAHPFP